LPDEREPKGCRLSRWYAFVRHADDFLVLAKTQPEIEKGSRNRARRHREQAEPQVLCRKTKIVSFPGGGFDFLAYHFRFEKDTRRFTPLDNLSHEVNIGE